MEATRPQGKGADIERAAHFIDDSRSDDVQAWEEIETGRFMPRRIRGSYQGRALG